MNRRTNVLYLAPRTWFGWVATAIVGLVLLVVAVLFAAVAVIAGLLIASFLVARALWLMRKAEKDRSRAYLQAEYEVEHEEATPPKDGASNPKLRRDI